MIEMKITLKEMDKVAWTIAYDTARGCSWPREIYIPEAEYDAAIASGVWEHRWTDEEGEDHLDPYDVFATYEDALDAADQHNIDNYDAYAGHPDIRKPDGFVVRRYGDPQEG